MSSFAIVLVMISTFGHATWNLLARRQRSEGAFFMRMLLLTMITGFLPAVISEIVTCSLPIRAWFYLVGSGLCCGTYFFSLARAYSSTDFTIVYPVARALPIVLVAFGDVIRGRELTGLGWLGLAFIVMGCLLTPLKSIRQFNFNRYCNRSMAWIMLTALVIMGYSLFDKAASEVVLPGPGTAARYGYMFFLLAGLVFMILRWLTDSNKQEHKHIGWLWPFLAAFCNFGSYWLVLWAYQLGQHASYVVAFRQFSIVIGVVVAFIAYKESGFFVRIVGAVLITAGLVIVGLFGN